MGAAPPPERSSGPSQPGGPNRRRHPADETARIYYSRFLGWLILAIIVAYVGLQMPLPWRVMTALAALIGVVGGLVLFVQCIRRKLPALVLIGAVLVTLSCGLFLATAGMQLIFWEASATFDECMRSALTQRSVNDCSTQYQDDIFSSLTGAPAP